MSFEIIKEGISTKTIFSGISFEVINFLPFYKFCIYLKFSDILIYASRSASVQFQFKVHGHLPLLNIMVEETEPKLGINFCFTIYGGERALMVAAKYGIRVYF
jgi:hypothetical protein